MKRISYLLIVGLLVVAGLRRLDAQTKTKEIQDDWKPGVEGAATGVLHGAELLYRSTGTYSIHSSSDLLGDSDGKINQNHIWELKVGIPVYFGKKLEVAGRFTYTNEEFSFETSDSNTYPLYNGLSNKNLKTIGGSVYAIGRLKQRMFFFARIKASLNGDYTETNIAHVRKDNFLKLAITPGIGWKINPQECWGVGLNYSYSFGNPLLLPVLAYRKSFSNIWGIEAILPARVTLRYHPNSNTYFYGRIGFKGGGYSIHLSDSLLNDYPTLELRRSEFNFSFNAEHSIKSWLWVSGTLGLQKGIKFDLTNSNHLFTLDGRRTRDKKRIIQSSTGASLFFQFSLFIVPSKQLIEKFRSVLEVF